MKKIIFPRLKRSYGMNTMNCLYDNFMTSLNRSEYLLGDTLFLSFLDPLRQTAYIINCAAWAIAGAQILNTDCTRHIVCR